MSSTVQLVLNTISVTTQGAGNGSNLQAAVLPTFAELCVAQMPEALNMASAAMISADDPNDPNASAISVAQSGPALPLPAGKTKTTSQNSSADNQPGLSTLTLPLPLTLFAAALPEPVSTDPLTGIEDGGTPSSSVARLSTPSWDSSSAAPISGSLSGSLRTGGGLNPPQNDLLTQFRVESTASIPSAFVVNGPVLDSVTTDSMESAIPLFTLPTDAVQAAEGQSQTGDPAQPIETAVAETSSITLTTPTAASTTARPSPITIPEASSSPADIADASATRDATTSNAGTMPVANQIPEQVQVAIASVQSVASPPQPEIPENAAMPLHAMVTAVKVPSAGHRANEAAAVAPNNLSAQPKTTASLPASIPQKQNLPVALHQATSAAIEPGSVSASNGSVHVTPTASFVESRQSQPVVANEPTSSFADSASQSSAQTTAIAVPHNGSQSNADAGNAPDLLQHKDTSAGSSGPSTPAAVNLSAANPSPPASAVDSSQPAAAATVIAGGISNGPQPSSSSPARPDALVNSNEAFSNLPADALHAPVPPGPVQMAQMVNRAAQAEMRIGMNTSEFGSVEVRTVVHANDVGVQIGSERGDLRSLLSTEIPGIANSLQQQNLRLTQVNFHQPGFNFTGNSPGGGNPQPRSFATKANAVVPSAPETSSESTQMEAPRSSATSSLSVLA